MEARTLDSFGFDNVSLIKVDVEGHEVEVLDGAWETIQRSHPALVLEISARGLAILESRLAAEGYRLRRLNPKWVDYIAVHEP